MNNTILDWCDKSWNPVTGCLHDCEYCYARGIAHRFCTQLWGADGCLHELSEPKIFDNSPGGDFDDPQFLTDTYPYGFDPTFHRYRLNEPQKLKTPQTIFVGSMCDLFGDWVPDSWIEEVFAACAAAPQHRYLFLTKNPERYQALYNTKILPYADNFWFGSTCTTPRDPFAWFHDTPYKSFLSIEPILEPFGYLESKYNPDWIIVGAETGNRKGKVIPYREWIENIVTDCRKNKIPVFMKSSLRGLMGADFVQEFPWEVGR